MVWRKKKNNTHLGDSVQVLFNFLTVYNKTDEDDCCGARGFWLCIVRLLRGAYERVPPKLLMSDEADQQSAAGGFGPAALCCAN